MSAWVVSHVHINVLVAARHFVRQAQPAAKLCEDLIDTDLGRMLWRENMISVAHCYPDKEETQIDEAALANYQYEPMAATPVEVIKAVHCYQYQTCEHDGWAASDAKKYTDELVDDLTRLLPGYTVAPWAFGEEWAAQQGIEGVAKSKMLAAGGRRHR